MLDKVKPSITRLLSGSALLFLVNIGNLIFISFDRVLLNLMAMPSEKIGLYQFADNISSIFHLGSSAILFLLTPIYLKGSIKWNIESVKNLSPNFKNSYILDNTLNFFLICSYFLIFYLFPNYLEAYGALIILSFSKYSALLLFVPVTLLTAFSKELLIIKAYFLAIIIMIFMQFWCYY